MNLFEKIYFTIFIILFIMWIIGTVLTLISDGEIFLEFLFYPFFIFIFLNVIYVIFYLVLRYIWDINIPFIRHFPNF